MAQLTRTTPMRVFTLLAVVMLVLAACSQDSGNSESQAPEGSEGAAPSGSEAAQGPGGELDTYTLGIFEDVTTDNQWAFNEATEGTLWNSYFLSPTTAGMYTISYPGIEFVPDLADGELQPATQDGDSWVGTITLRDGLLWSDGEALTAEDVAFTWQTV